jgi:hypothetical protein
VSDVPRLIGARGQVDDLANQLDGELLGKVGPDLLVRGDEDIVGVGVPRFPERIDRGPVDEGRVELAVDAMVQEPMLVERLDRIEGAEHIRHGWRFPSGRGCGLSSSVLAVVRVVPHAPLIGPITCAMSRSRSSACPGLVAGLVEDLDGADGLAGRHVEHRRRSALRSQSRWRRPPTGAGRGA